MPSKVTVMISTSSAPKPAVNACLELVKEVGLSMASSLPDCGLRLDACASRRVLPVKILELRVDLWIGFAHRQRRIEEGLAHDCKKFRRTLGGIRVDEDVFVGV